MSSRTRFARSWFQLVTTVAGLLGCQIIAALREPHGVTSLSPREILACFRLKLWDPDQNRMVPFP